MGRRVVAPGDGVSYYLPLQAEVGDLWRRGVFPAWDSGSFSGSPLFALHQSAPFHPGTLASAFLPELLAYNLTVVGSLSLAGAGAFALTRRYTNDGFASTVAGCAFALCGFWFAHLAHLSILTTTAWLPWMIWAADRIAADDEDFEDRRVEGAKRTRRGLLPMVLIATAAALSGHGQMLAWSSVVAVAYAFLASPAGRRSRTALWTGAALVVGGLLAAVQLLPVAIGLGQSDRSALTLTEATAWSYDPASLLTAVFPFAHGGSPAGSPYQGPWSMTELSGYVGMAALVLGLVGVVARRGDRRVVALVLTGLIATLVALGDSTPVGRLVHALPVLGAVRSWARYTAVLQLVVAVAAGVGVATIRSQGPRRAPMSRSLARGLAFLAGLLIVSVLWADPYRVTGQELGWTVGAPLVAGMAAVLLVAATRRFSSPGGRAAIGASLLILVCVDPVVNFGWWFHWRNASPSVADATQLLDGSAPRPWGTVPDQAGGIDRYLWAGDPLAALPSGPRWASRWGLSSVTGMDPLAPTDYLDLTGTDYWGQLEQPERLLGSRTQLLDLLRVTLVATPGPSGVERHVRQPTLPEGFLVASARPVDRAEAVAVALGDEPTDLARHAVYEGNCDGCSPEAPFSPEAVGTVGPVHREPSSIEVEVSADRPAFLVLSEAWDPGWVATVDGVAVPVLRTNGVVLGVPVPSGPSTVTYRYEVPGLRLGAWISAGTAAAIGLSAAIVIAGRKRNQDGDDG